ncbi:phytoene desaturase family protein [Bounagaea algeriensis]
MSTAVVVGAGPNGLAAAVTLAERGVAVTVLEAADEVGGGTRSYEAIRPGLVHDRCSAVHPMGVGSPFLQRRDLARYGLRWRYPEIDCAHPLDGGDAGVLHRSVDDTARELGSDGTRWRTLFGNPSAAYDELRSDVLRPLLHVPRHPLLLARFGIPAAAPAAALVKLFGTERARALLGGVAAHGFRPLHRPFSAAVGLGLLTAGHRYGWAVAEGGSQRVTDALAALLHDLGGTIVRGAPVRSAADLPAADVVLHDLAPPLVAALLGDRLPPRTARAYSRFRRGPGAFKVDFAVDGGVPWTAPAARRAGTVHLGGSFREIAAAERAVNAGRMPQRPFVLVGQQYLADPQRSAGSVHPVWTYAHVPHDYAGDATEAITAQVERFAPGFRERIVDSEVRPPARFAAENANFAGGDIMTGAKDFPQLVFGPRTTLHPYDVGVAGHYLCSAATPPGPGAHGMCGHHAALRALRYLRSAGR